MQIISRLLLAVVDWLSAPGGDVETLPSTVDWADLPTYHQSQD